jgi:hypothetical protein
MRFTVLGGTPLAPLALPAFMLRPTLIANAPTRIKTLHNIIDANGNAQRSTDGLDFSVPTTDYPLVGSTEQWDILNIGGGTHQVHLHLIEFQVVSRQTINTAAYLRQWQLMNGLRPVTRPIVIDPTPYLTGAVVPALPYESGWKDTVRAPGNQLTRIVARWAPQELAASAVIPGLNPFPIDPTTGPGYVWHCHTLGHEDNDMMRPLRLVNAWKALAVYSVGTVVTYQDVNYRIRLAHPALLTQPPPTRFDRYERVNNNDGAWQPQIIYAVGDRVLYAGQLYMADAVHQSQVGQTPDITPSLWHSFPMTACGQLQELCHDSTSPVGVNCHTVGHAGDEAICLSQHSLCLSACQGGAHAHSGSPCSGLCANPVTIVVPDGTTFTTNSGAAPACLQTTSELLKGSCLPGGREVFMNGRKMLCNGVDWALPLPTQRHHGYCIQSTPGPPNMLNISLQ